MAARAGVEPTTLRLKAIDSTKAPPCPTLLPLFPPFSETVISSPIIVSCKLSIPCSSCSYSTPTPFLSPSHTIFHTTWHNVGHGGALVNFQPKGRGFDSRAGRHVGTLGMDKSFT